MSVFHVARVRTHCATFLKACRCTQTRSGRARSAASKASASSGKITLHDLKSCKLANVFFDTFFNIEKYLDHEQREQASLLRVSGPAGAREGRLPRARGRERARGGFGGRAGPRTPCPAHTLTRAHPAPRLL